MGGIHCGRVRNAHLDGFANCAHPARRTAGDRLGEQAPDSTALDPARRRGSATRRARVSRDAGHRQGDGRRHQNSHRASQSSRLDRRARDRPQLPRQARADGLGLGAVPFLAAHRRRPRAPIVGRTASAKYKCRPSSIRRSRSSRSSASSAWSLPYSSSWGSSARCMHWVVGRERDDSSTRLIGFGAIAVAWSVLYNLYEDKGFAIGLMLLLALATRDAADAALESRRRLEETDRLKRPRTPADRGRQARSTPHEGTPPPVVILLQTVLPDYRRPFLEELRRSLEARLVIVTGESGFEPTVRLSSVDAETLVVRNVYLPGRRLLWQRGSVRPRRIGRLNRRAQPARPLDVAGLTIRRLLGRPTLAWGHAWPRSGRATKRTRIRNLMRRFATDVIVYTHSEAEALARRTPGKRIHAAPNGLYPASRTVEGTDARPGMTSSTSADWWSQEAPAPARGVRRGLPDSRTTCASS